MDFRLRKYKEPDFNQERFVNAPDALLGKAPTDMSAPDDFHATSIFPEYFKINGTWLLAEDSRMDCLPVYEDGKIHVREFRNVKKGDLVVMGRTENCEDGIYVHADCFEEEEEEKGNAFTFRQSRSRETAFSYDYEYLQALLRHEKDHGHIVWILGPAATFDHEAREAFSKLVAGGYVHGMLAGNALATHDLEGALLGTALGQNIKTQRGHFNGHYNHIDVLNKVNFYGSIPKFLEEEKIDNGIMYNCIKYGVPFVLNGSIRDDGPLPEVYEHTYEGQDAIRSHIRKATTVIGLATVLHTIAAGNMTPTYRVMADGTIRQIYFYTVDTSEFAVNKLGDRGSLASKGIVTNVQDFLTGLAKGLKL